MTDHQDPLINTACSPAELKYAIRSAREVIEALIGRDQNAAEEAALRTCRDCDLLIRLIRDLALLLQNPSNQQFGFDPVETAALTRRTEHVLALVDAPQSGSQSSVTAARDLRNDKSPGQHKRGGPTTRQRRGAAPIPSPSVLQVPTVASLGLRVHLVPFAENDHPNVSGNEPKIAASLPAAGDAPRGPDEH
jgi:hypothetical protein